MKIRAIIAEDERLAREELAYLLHQEDDFILCPMALDGLELLRLVNEYQPDVIFLDIQMPHLDGIAVAHRLDRMKINGDSSLPFIIFTTAYENHAVDAFHLGAIDYLLKPYDQNRFKMTISRIRHRLREMRLGYEEINLKTIQNPYTSANSIYPQNIGDVEIQPSESGHVQKITKILVDNGDKVVVVSPESILYAVRMERFVEIHTVREVLQFRGTLNDLEARLAGWAFFRSHRAYLVNLDVVHEMIPWLNGAYTIVLSDAVQTKIPVSRGAVKELFQLLSK